MGSQESCRILELTDAGSRSFTNIPIDTQTQIQSRMGDLGVNYGEDIDINTLRRTIETSFYQGDSSIHGRGDICGFENEGREICSLLDEQACTSASHCEYINTCNIEGKRGNDPESCGTCSITFNFLVIFPQLPQEIVGTHKFSFAYVWFKTTNITSGFGEKFLGAVS